MADLAALSYKLAAALPGAIRARALTNNELTIEVEGGEKPACVAECLVRLYG